jgi:hypothetical protein
MFITPAFAQAAGDAAAGVNPLLQLAPFVAVIGIIGWWFTLRNDPPKS